MTLLVIFLIYAIGLSVALGRARVRPVSSGVVSTPHVRPARVLIIGATGGTGRELLNRALDRGYAVTALVRDPAKLTIQHPALTVLRGDVLDPAAVDAAMQNQDAVLCALGHRKYFYPTRILSEGTRNLLSAMASRRVARIVCETSLGIGDSAGRMGLYYTFFVIPVILPWYFWDKTRQERLIAASDREWVIVRPGVLTNGSMRGRVRSGRGIGSFVLTVRISRADVAEFMLDQLISDDFVRSAPGVCG